ncbi:tyrosine-type recombinase/integrase, partial [Aeromonas caviae]
TDQLNRYQLTPAMVDELVEKIHLLKAFKTQRGAQRLLYSTSHHLNLLPGALRSHKEQIELRKVVKLARQVYREQRAAFIEWIGYLLVRSNTRNTGIPFTDPQMLQAFLSVTVLLLPATRIAIEVRCGAKRSEKAPWREVISRYRVKSEFIEKSGANRALLRIIHPDEAGICQRSTERQQNADTVKPMARYSTPLLRTVAYVVALKVMSIQELVSLGNKKKADFARQTARELTD